MPTTDRSTRWVSFVNPTYASCTVAQRARIAHHQHGLSILEFTLVVSIFSALIVFAANRVTDLRVDLERAAVEHTLSGMRSALALEFSELIVQGKKERIREWAGGNPLELFENRNVLEAEAGADPGPGDWHYDRERGEVVYRPAYPERPHRRPGCGRPLAGSRTRRRTTERPRTGGGTTAARHRPRTRGRQHRWMKPPPCS
ncbi:MAG: hypothetical protein U5K73_09125 [Halofilum sp. (in: g-proteobacteria)]|nr:hypothetical protein [Halofilum sp. (in: g-proteobacteria)]